MLFAFTRRATLAVAVPVAGAALVLSHAGPAQAAPATTPQAVIASATAHYFRIVVTATKTSNGAAPTATVHVKAYSRRAGSWRSDGRLQLGARNAFFWNVLEGGHAVRDFTISNDSPARGSVRLLLTPALGWSPAYQFQLAHGQLIA
jgi:hypothetical protein